MESRHREDSICDTNDAYAWKPVLKGDFYICRSEQPGMIRMMTRNTDDDPKSNDTKDTSNSKKPQNPTTANKLKKQKITKVSSTYKKSVGQSFTLKPKAKGKITYKTGNKKVATDQQQRKSNRKGNRKGNHHGNGKGKHPPTARA